MTDDTNTTDKKLSRDEQYVRDWIEAEKKNGLVDIKFYPFANGEILKRDAIHELAAIVEDIQENRVTKHDVSRL